MSRFPTIATLAVAFTLAGCIPQVEQPPEYASRPAPYPPQSSQPAPAPPPPPPQAYEPPAPSTPPSQPAGDACGSTLLSAYINLLPSQDVKDKVASIVGSRPTRWIAYGSPVTMDFNAERLNAELGQDGRIKAFRCY